MVLISPTGIIEAKVLHLLASPTAVLHALIYTFLYTRVSLRVQPHTCWSSVGPSTRNAGWYYLKLFCAYRTAAAAATTVDFPRPQKSTLGLFFIIITIIAIIRFFIASVLSVIAHNFLFSAVKTFVDADTAAEDGRGARTAQKLTLGAGHALFCAGLVRRAWGTFRFEVTRLDFWPVYTRHTDPAAAVLLAGGWTCLVGAAVVGRRRPETATGRAAAALGGWVLLYVVLGDASPGSACWWAAVALQVAVVACFLRWRLPSWEELRNVDVRRAVGMLGQRVRRGLRCRTAPRGETGGREEGDEDV